MKDAENTGVVDTLQNPELPRRGYATMAKRG
jgi:hypothetical protein